MEKPELRRADFKTGLVLIAFCLWFLSITFLFMPFKETYGGVENVWYVSPWIFPAVVLSLLLLLSMVLTIQAARQQGFRDLIEFPAGRLREFRLTRPGVLMVVLFAAASAGGLIYLIHNIEQKIQASIEEARWLANPSQAHIHSWTDPVSIAALAGLTIILIAAIAILILSWLNHQHRDNGGRAAGGTWQPSEATIRFGIIALLFCVLVYVLIPNIDFFIALVIFLTVFTVTFHVPDPGLARITMGAYVALGMALALVFATGMDASLNAGWEYTTDLVVFTATFAYMVWGWRRLVRDPEVRGKFRTCLVISWVTPLVLAPVFRFGLLVPLPHEGGAIELMHQLRYLLK